MSTYYHQGIQRIPYLLGVVLLSLSISGCCCLKKCIVPNDPIKAPAAFAFIDGNVVSNSYVPNVKVTLIDDSKGKVRTSSGTSFNNLELRNGVMNLGLHYKASVNSKEPYEYNIKAEAPGYITTWKTILLTDEEARYFPVFMVKLDSPPPGISTLSAPIPINSNGMVTSDIPLRTPPMDSITQQFSFSIPKGTYLLCDGERVSNAQGNLAKIQLAYASPLAPNGGRIFPNGFLVTGAIDKKADTIMATPTTPFLFASAGWMSASIQVGEQEVNGFSNAVQGKMEIARKLINAETQKEFQEGDLVPIWSLDEETGNWQLEENALVKNSNGVLGVNFNMEHLSTWNVDQPVVKCQTPISIKIENQGSMDRIHYVEIVKAQTGEDMITAARDLNLTTFEPGPEDDDNLIVNVPENIDMALVIYKNDNPNPEEVMVISDIIESCNNPSDIILPEVPNPLCINLYVTINDDEVSDNAIWYRPCPSLNPAQCQTMNMNMIPWRYLGVLNDGKLVTPSIDSSIYYHFLIWYGDPNTNDQEASIKFRISYNPFNLSQPCIEFPTDQIVVEGASSIILNKIYSRLPGNINPTCNPEPTITFGGCPQEIGEVTVKITIDGAIGT